MDAGSLAGLCSLESPSPLQATSIQERWHVDSAVGQADRHGDSRMALGEGRHSLTKPYNYDKEDQTQRIMGVFNTEVCLTLSTQTLSSFKGKL